MKRLNNFFHKLPCKNNAIINLQETHLGANEVSKLKYQWKWGCLQSPAINNSGGVAILYNESYFDQIIRTKIDHLGRLCAIYAKKDEETYYFLNLYSPNNHYVAEEFINKIDDWLEEAIEYEPLINIVISGDFNVVFNNQIDCVNRNQTCQEKVVVKKLEQLKLKYKMVDSYRHHNTYGGFTWGRDNPSYLRSRLDHILVSKTLADKSISSNVTANPNESDHNLLYTEISLDRVPYGPGITRANAAP